MSKRKDNIFFKSGTPRWFKTDINFEQPDLKVDAEKGIIRDVSVCTAGEAKGHDVMLEQSFIEDVVRLGNEWQTGLKCRFGHPTMSSEALGTYLGRFTNFRVSGIKAIADLQLDELSKDAPGGDLYSYVLAMAQKNPDMFGTSIVFMYKDFYHYDEDGQKQKGGNPGDGPTFASIDKLLATDVVDEPAANPGGLFSGVNFNSEQFAVRIAGFLDENPDIWQFVDKHPDKFKPFLDKYAAYKQRQSKIPMAKKTMKPKGLFGRLAAAFQSAALSTIDASTADGNNIRIQAENEDPAVGDEVYVVAEDGSESVAPDGDHTIADGPYDGWVLTISDGLITAIVKPEDTTGDAPVNPPVEASTGQQSNGKTPDQLQAENDDLHGQLKKLSDEFEAYKKKPLAEHTDVVPGEDSNGAKNPKSEDQFWSQPWNKKHRKTA